MMMLMICSGGRRILNRQADDLRKKTTDPLLLWRAYCEGRFPTTATTRS
jgi:hypothetical protein